MTGKAKYRKDAFYALKERAEAVYRSKQVNLSDIGEASRLGTKIINCSHLGLSLDGRPLLKDFTYNFQRYERVGIVGHNGIGKTSLVELLLGTLDTSGGHWKVSGDIQRGESLNIGYYRQEGMDFEEDQTVLETVSDTRLLGRFMFPHEMLNNKVSSLSGGERRRLFLLTILMQKPNLLVLDEPTNDLDIVTLDVLEEWLLEFKGTLLIVSHDRHFLDRLVDHLFILTGEGEIKDYIGKYSEWRTCVREVRARKKAVEKASVPQVQAVQPGKEPSKRRLSFKEKRELEGLEAEIEALNKEKNALEEGMNSGTLPYETLQQASSRFAEISSLLDEKETRWLELSEIEV